MGYNAQKLAKDLENAKSMADLERILKTNTTDEANTKRPRQVKPSDFPNTWVGKLKRKAHELLKGGEAYYSEGNPKIKTVKKTIPETIRTKSVSSSLKDAGLTDEEIGRMRK